MAVQFAMTEPSVSDWLSMYPRAPRAGRLLHCHLRHVSDMATGGELRVPYPVQQQQQAVLPSVHCAADSALRRRQRRLCQCLRHERMTVAMALAEATHHKAPRRQKPASAITVNDAPRGQKNAAAEYCELREVAPARGMRPAPLGEPRTQERVQRRTVEHVVDSSLVVPSLHVPVPKMENQLVETYRHLDVLVLEQATEVPKISSSSRHPCRRRVLRVPQTAEQLVEVPTIVSLSFFVRLWGRTWTFQFLMVVAVGLGREGLQSFSLRQNSTAFRGAEHVDIPVPRGGLDGSRLGQGSTASSFHSDGASDKAFTWVF